MDYNPRQSSIYRSGGVAANGGSTRKHIPRCDDPYPILDVKEIAVCLRDSGVAVTEESLAKPTGQLMQLLFENIADILLGITPSNTIPTIEACTSDSEYPETLLDGCSIISLQRALYRFLLDCGFPDFCLNDIINPDPFRTRRILSAIVNFARFREEHWTKSEDLEIRRETYLTRYDRALEINKRLTTEIAAMEQRAKNEGDTIKIAEEQKANLESQLWQLKKTHDQLTVEHNTYKEERQRLLNRLDDWDQQLQEIRKEVEKIKPYADESVDNLQQMNKDLSDKVAQEKRQLEAIEKRGRAFRASGDVLIQLEQEIKAAFKAMEECEVELARDEEAKKKLNRFIELKDQRSIEQHDIDRKIQQLERQLASSEDRNERLRQQATAKQREAQRKMSELSETYSKLVDERKARMSEMDKKRGYLDQLEKDMAEKRESFENELRTSSIEYDKLRAHVNLYIAEMEDRLTSVA